MKRKIGYLKRIRKNRPKVEFKTFKTDYDNKKHVRTIIYYRTPEARKQYRDSLNKQLRGFPFINLWRYPQQHGN